MHRSASSATAPTAWAVAALIPGRTLAEVVGVVTDGQNTMPEFGAALSVNDIRDESGYAIELVREWRHPNQDEIANQVIAFNRGWAWPWVWSIFSDYADRRGKIAIDKLEAVRC